LPEYLQQFNPSKPLHVWMQEKIYNYINKLFKIRYAFERKATYDELVVLDLELFTYLKPENLKKNLLIELEDELSNLRVMMDIINIENRSKSDE